MEFTNSDIVSLTEFRRHLHRHPEVSGDEVWTARTIAERLAQDTSAEVFTGLGGHGVAAVFDSGSPGPTVMLRAELDGLPIEELGTPPYRSTHAGRGHMCGHDGHMAALMGCAVQFERQSPVRGRIVLMFQPAEETGAGAAAVMADPRYDQIAPDYVFAWHNMPGTPLGAARLHVGPMFCASTGMKVRLTGRTAHASNPETGCSPALALAELIPSLTALGPGGEMNDAFRLVTLTHTRLGEPTFGVAPGEAELFATLRAVAQDQMDALCQEAETLTARVAKAHDLGLSLDWPEGFAATVNDAEATEIMLRSLDALSVPHAPMTAPFRASEDVGRFGQSGKLCVILLGAGEDMPALHNPDYDFPDTLIPLGARIMAHAARQLVG